MKILRTNWAWNDSLYGLFDKGWLDLSLSIEPVHSRAKTRNTDAKRKMAETNASDENVNVGQTLISREDQCRAE